MIKFIKENSVLIWVVLVIFSLGILTGWKLGELDASELPFKISIQKKDKPTMYADIGQDYKLTVIGEGNDRALWVAFPLYYSKALDEA